MRLTPLFLSLGAAAAAAPKEVLLFYTCVTPQIGNQCEEGVTLDQAGVATYRPPSGTRRAPFAERD